MIAVVIGIAILTATGYPLVRMIDPTQSRVASVGTGFMAGCGLAALVMMVLSVAGLRWSIFAIVIPLVVIAVIADRRRRREPGELRSMPGRSAATIILDAATALSLTGYALFATVARPWEWDFWAIWGLKGRVFFVTRGIDIEFLANPDVYYSHPDYPPLLPLLYDFMAVVKGEWDDRWLGLLFVAFASALVLVLRDELLRATESKAFSALATLALSGAACSPWIGLGEGALVALGTAGLLVLARGVRDDDGRAIVLAAVLLGVGAMAKNEGLALAVAAAISLIAFRRQQIAGFVLPVALFAAPWLLWRATLSIETDVVSGGVLGRVTERLSDPVGFASTLAAVAPDRSGFWLILGLLLLAGGREIVRRQGVMLAAALIQVVFYIGIYAGTMHDLASHVQTSLSRISSHLAVAVGAICAIAIWDLLLRESILISSTTVVAETVEEEVHDVDQ